MRSWTIPARRVTKCGECPKLCCPNCRQCTARPWFRAYRATPSRGIPSWCPMIRQIKAKKLVE